MIISIGVEVVGSGLTCMRDSSRASIRVSWWLDGGVGKRMIVHDGHCFWRGTDCHVSCDERWLVGCGIRV